MEETGTGGDGGPAKVSRSQDFAHAARTSYTGVKPDLSMQCVQKPPQWAILSHPVNPGNRDSQSGPSRRDMIRKAVADFYL